MNRIKSIEEVILGDSEVLLEMVEGKRDSGIVLPNDGKLSDTQGSAYAIVRSMGALVKDLEIGDIAVKTRVDKAPAYKYNDKTYLLISRYNIAIAVKPANFDSNDESELAS